MLQCSYRIMHQSYSSSYYSILEAPTVLLNEFIFFITWIHANAKFSVLGKAIRDKVCWTINHLSGIRKSWYNAASTWYTPNAQTLGLVKACHTRQIAMLHAYKAYNSRSIACILHEYILSSPECFATSYYWLWKFTTETTLTLPHSIPGKQGVKDIQEQTHTGVGLKETVTVWWGFC